MSSAFTKGEYTYRRRGSAAATGDIRITDPKSPADLNILMDPQPFPRRLLGNNRSMTRIIRNQGTRIANVETARYEIFTNTRFTSRDTTAIDNSRLVTALVIVDG